MNKEDIVLRLGIDLSEDYLVLGVHDDISNLKWALAYNAYCFVLFRSFGVVDLQLVKNCLKPNFKMKKNLTYMDDNGLCYNDYTPDIVEGAFKKYGYKYDWLYSEELGVAISRDLFSEDFINFLGDSYSTFKELPKTDLRIASTAQHLDNHPIGIMYGNIYTLWDEERPDFSIQDMDEGKSENETCSKLMKMFNEYLINNGYIQEK